MLERLTLTRKENWPTLMYQCLQGINLERMEWGVLDCALFAALHIDAMCGTELYTTHNGHYSDRAGSEAYLESIQVADLTDLATQLLGPPMALVAKAQRGDIVTFDTLEGTGLGVVDLDGTRIAALSRTGKGLDRLPINLGISAWRV